MEKVLLKISGELFDSAEKLNSIIDQIKTISNKYTIGIVIGAGNIFRGEQHGKRFGLEPFIGDNAGMLATIINGLILKNLLEKKDVSTKILSAIPVPTISENLSQEKINEAFDKNQIIVFVGGTGNPFFTTDTNAILRGLQIKADIVLKGTKVDGVFDSDPKIKKDAKLLKTLSYDNFYIKNLQVMDLTAITLAKKHKLKIKIFNIFKKDSILRSLEDPSFGSTIS